MRTMKLLVFPAIALLFFIGAVSWSSREFKLLISGDSVPGWIVGMGLTKEEGTHDLLTGLRTEARLYLANGETIEATRLDGTILEVTRNFPDQPAPETIPVDNLEDRLPSETFQVLTETLTRKAEIIRWSLMREERRSEDPFRVVKIRREDTVYGYFEMTELPLIYEVHNKRPVIPGRKLETTHITAVFDRTDPEWLADNKGDSLAEYAYSRDGEAIEPANQDFYLYAEPYFTEFRPVFEYESDGKQIARLSHIGRMSGPTLALSLYSDCTVYYDPDNIENAILIADPGPLEGDPFLWFSRFCEGLFGQWGSTSLIILVGSVFLIVGLTLITLAVWPGIDYNAGKIKSSSTE